MIVVAALALATFIIIHPLPQYSSSFSYSAALVVVTLALWSSGIVAPFLSGLIFFALATIFKLLPPETLFSGFASTAIWLIISGFVIGAAITHSGIGQRLASSISPYLSTSYPRLIAGLVCLAMLLGFVMPSSVGRAVVLIPIGMALADKLGFEHASNGRLGIATALAIACNMPSFAILPANIPNMILAGSSESLFEITIGYTEYLLLHFPILGLLKSCCIVWLVLRIFPAEISVKTSFQETKQEQQPLAAKQQKKVALLLGITLLFWVTDSIHGVNPAWVGLVTAILLLFPKWGVLETKSFNGSVDFATVIFVAAALGLGALVNQSGIAASLGELFSQVLPNNPEQPFVNFMALSLISTFTGLITTIPGVPTVLSPMAADFSQLTGFSLTAVLMTQVIGFSTVIFPYQVGPLVLAMQLSNQPLGQLLKITLPLTAITILLLMPLDYLWWLMLGWL